MGTKHTQKGVNILPTIWNTKQYQPVFEKNINYLFFNVYNLIEVHYNYYVEANQLGGERQIGIINRRSPCSPKTEQ